MDNLQQDACSRARFWISLRLDNELSELELQALRGHLGRCHQCREFEYALSCATTSLREQPLVRMERPVTLPPRRRRVVLQARVMSAVGAAATIVVATGAFLNFSGSNHALHVGSVPAHFDSPPADRTDVRALKRQVLQRSAELKPHYAHTYAQRSWVDDL
jgi:predicted anti-sigma-YlaC factor YlaD